MLPSKEHLRKYKSTIASYTFQSHNRLMNGYQKAKARKIVKLLLSCSEQAGVTRFQLSKMVSIMSEAQWRTVVFTAGVPVADIPAKRIVLAELRNRSIHAA
jgi:hypothetical protein